MKFNGLIIGNGSGKLGNTVGYVVAGQQLLRAYQPDVTVSQEQPSRNVRWAKFRPAVVFTAMLKYYDVLLYPSAPSGKTRYAQLLKDMFPAFGGTEGAPTVNLALAQVGNGTLRSADFLTAVKNGTNQIDLTWSTAINLPNEEATDTIKVFVTTSTNDLTYLCDTGDTRATGVGTITVPEAMDGLLIQVSEIFYQSTDGTLASKVKIKGALANVNLAP